MDPIIPRQLPPTAIEDFDELFPKHYHGIIGKAQRRTVPKYEENRNRIIKLATLNVK